MDRKLNVLLMQLPVPNNPSLNTPLAAGYLKAYAYAQGLAGAVAIEVLPRALADHAGDARLVAAIVAERPDVLGVSLYTWNSERTLAVVRRVKERLPELLVVAGGPEVQKDNLWVLEHPAVDVAVVGEGEQTFVELLRLWSSPGRGAGLAIPLLGESAAASPLARIPGIAYREAGALQLTADRHALDDLAGLPSPYLSGYLDVPRDGMLMVEVSRWCPYSCSFCLYGKSMGSKLGNRYFSLERVLDEIRWADARGIRRVHFVEANLNLVPLFWPLMHALAELNADHHMTFYAELRGEHLTEEVVEALDRANVRYVEVGLQTANPIALQASLRRTDLRKWAAGTRRLYAHNIEVYLDVILGLPADDEAGVQHTLDFIQGEELGPYDIFTLQVLPGTTVRQQAEQFGLRFQERPPYYVLGTSELGYANLRALRWELRERTGFDPQAVEGMPEPIFESGPLSDPSPRLRSWSAEGTERIDPAAGKSVHHEGGETAPLPLKLLELDCAEALDWAQLGHNLACQVAGSVTLVVHSPDPTVLRQLCWPIAEANPTIHWDLVLFGTPSPGDLRTLHAQWPHTIGYLDRVAVYRRLQPEPPWVKVTPRFFVVTALDAGVDPLAYEGIAELLWLVEEPDGQGASAGTDGETSAPDQWLAQALDQAERRGGNGVVLPALARRRAGSAVDAWRERTGARAWEYTASDLRDEACCATIARLGP